MIDCLFCKFVSGEIKTNIIYEDENVLGFEDIYPMAKIHLLFIPKVHTEDIGEMCKNDDNVGNIFKVMMKYVLENQLDKNGYRIVTNKGEYAGQSIFHTHFHLLAEEKLGKFGKSY